MMAQVVFDETGDEVIAVVVAVLHAQVERVSGSQCGDLQDLRFELGGQKLVAVALIDEDGQLFGGRGDELAGVPFSPLRAVFAKVTRESLFAPGHDHRVADRREGGKRLVAARIAQGADQRAVAAHRMAADAALVGNWEAGLDQRRQFVHHVVVHPVMLRPRGLRRVEVETGAMAKIPAAIRIARHVVAARAGVGGDDDHAEFGSNPVGAGFLHESLVGAAQARKPVEHRQLLAAFDLRWQINREHHVAAERGRAVPVAFIPAAGAFLAGEVFEGHGRCLRNE